MEVTTKVTGLNETMNALRAAFPSDIKKQRSLLNRALSAAAREAIVPMAKQLALRGDESGALSQSIAVRARSASNALRRGAVASVAITPVRSDKKALALYLQHYYNSRGLAAPMKLLTRGIQHGHLVEFGTVKQAPSPFLYPAAMAGFARLSSKLAEELKKKSQAAVRRAAKQGAKK